MFRKVLLFSLMIVLASACFSYAEEGAQKAERGKQFIDFTAKSLDNDNFKFSEFIKGKAVALKFGATWCGPCRKMWGELEKIYKNVDNFTVVEVDLLNPQRGETEEKVREENKKLKTPWPVVLDSGSAIARKYLTSGGIPETYFIDAQGVVKYNFVGYRSYESLKEIIDAVANGTPIPADPGTIGAVFPDFTLTDCEKKDFNLAKALKKGPVVIKFGATWCGPCKKMTPILNSLVTKYKKKVTVIEVDLVDGKRDTKEKVIEEYKKTKPSYRVLLDDGLKVWGNVNGKSIPITIVLDKNGVIVAKETGVSTIEKLTDPIDKLLKKKTSEKTPEPNVKDE